MTTRLGFTWGSADWTPTVAEIAAASTEIDDEIPASLLADWGAGTVTQLSPDSQGTVDLATLRAYAEDRIDDLNAARPAGSDTISLTGSNNQPRFTVYVYVGGQLVCQNLYRLDLGGSSWNPPGTGSPQIMLSIEWDMP